MEIWKTIDGYPNYEISSIGRVKNKKTNKILKPYILSNNLIKISEKAGIPRKRVQIIETGEIFNSLHDCAKQINGRVSNIIGCLKGRQKTHRGYHFKEP